jgi:ribosomal protein S18 acetylase RimI-like enzyme
VTASEPIVALRPETAADLALSRAIYAATREQELALVPWTPAQREAFLAQQFDAQRQHYRAHHPRAQWSIVVVDGADAGRLYLDQAPDTLLLIDIALLPTYRGRGIGRRLMAGVLARSEGAGIAIQLHVEHDNPALHWYRRLGFVVDGDTGVYWRMRRQPGAAMHAEAAA